MANLTSKIRTRLLILSDTHGVAPASSAATDAAAAAIPAHTRTTPFLGPFTDPLPQAEVVIHCGDLTRSSRIREYRTTFDFLRRLAAPLKLVIAGNHDWALDRAFIDSQPPDFVSPQERARRLDLADMVEALVQDARADGVHYLTEGTHQFVLDNGARLKVFASPYTPQYGYWAFQYAKGTHVFPIPSGCDVAMTHGPPYQMLDLTRLREEAGCPILMRKMAAARPKVHCFGHIHEAWGAQLVNWEAMLVNRDAKGVEQEPNDPILTIETLATISPQLVDSTLSGDGREEEVARRAKRLTALHAAKARYLSLCAGDAHALRPGEQTLFINAAIMDIGYRPSQLPWLVELELDRADAPSDAEAVETATTES